MKEEKFQVINFIRNLIIEIDKELTNFPKKDIELKNRIRNNSYDLLEIVYEANTTNRDTEKIKLLEKAVAKIKVIDFLLNLSYDKMIINNKKYIKLGQRMDDIIKYTTGWMKNINLDDFDSVYICGLEIEERTGIEIVSWLEENKGANLQIYFAPGPRLTKIDSVLISRIFALNPVIHLNELESQDFARGISTLYSVSV